MPEIPKIFEDLNAFIDRKLPIPTSEWAFRRALQTARTGENLVIITEISSELWRLLSVPGESEGYTIDLFVKAVRKSGPPILGKSALGLVFRGSQAASTRFIAAVNAVNDRQLARFMNNGGLEDMIGIGDSARRRTAVIKASASAVDRVKRLEAEGMGRIRARVYNKFLEQKVYDSVTP